MLETIIRFSIKNKLIVLLGTVALIAWGVNALLHIPIDAVPDITNNQVQVITTSPSLSAQEVERLITFPVEQTMATIPRIKQMRSISRFGLSVVTIVFNDNVDIYWARQQISERLAQAKADIPAGVGNPKMAPVTTGLGEIYQYTLQVNKNYTKQYSLSQLRSIQDWVIRRQLLGTDGVADISSFGGYLKQYEIALNPDKLRSMKLSIDDIFNALNKNNQNTGGAYIESGPSALFIRSEGLITSTDDIANIVVANTPSGVPVLIRDIGIVQEGHAVRYGAMTYNNSGETVGGIVMMLKGANSNDVIQRVKKKIAEIQQTLPPGIHIEPFLDRTQLVGRAIHTVEKNLIEGALIVIFVLVIFLGNIRAGLLVSSVIPLSMLFALGMMNLFGVSGNLMSLGAIDFGLIVDGAVIIVEAVMHVLSGTIKAASESGGKLSPKQMDETVSVSATRMMSAATFGQIIILVVYLPILSLAGIEGKMFRPMAETVGFAIVGAILLALTYVPMMSAWVLSRSTGHKPTFADKLMDRIQKIYTPALMKALKKRGLIVSFAIGLLVLSFFLFSRMGGEFLPTLDEGDFAVETRLVTGSSLTQTIQTAQQAAGILMKQFPEVKKVIGKVGTSEIPTDPMPLESCDLIIVLKDKKEWTSAKDWQELADKMSKALEVLPQASFGFQQPIQMRFNELIAGAKQDVAVKIFGDDLDVLTRLATQVGKLASGIKGATDIYVEQATGLPQIVIKYDRQAMARYGLSIEDLNKAVQAGFAGGVAGTVYEGERRYDMVVRLDTVHRQSVDDLKNLYVSNAAGMLIPLAQVADVQIKAGPNQIQRERAQRRIMVGFNTRGRDVESIVNELQSKVKEKVTLPEGYHISYGGQFQNLIEAKQRLSIAVPVALLLIFLLLFFAFHSLGQSLLIFSAIPFAAVGGVFALLLRGMPFSISAGVGFIALFGVAVLNGIVLVAEFNRLKKQGITDVYQRVREATASRIRPVLMTASVASLGFLPMAVATTAGAEVQRPLATVVIGGLITSTLLTLFVLPIIYTMMENIAQKKANRQNVVTAMLLLIGIALLPSSAYAQDAASISWKTLPDMVVNNNKQVAAGKYEIRAGQALKGAAWDPGKTYVRGMFGQYNSYDKRDNNFTVIQTIPFPTQMQAQHRIYKAELKSTQQKLELTKHQLVYSADAAYLQLLYLRSLRKLYDEEDSLYATLEHITARRVAVGEVQPIEQTMAESKYAMIRAKQEGFDASWQQALAQLRSLLQVDTINTVITDTLEKITFLPSDTANYLQHPQLLLARQNVQVAAAKRNMEQQKLLPDFTLGYFNQTLIGAPLGEGTTALAGTGDRFQGVEAGINIPLFFGAQAARAKAARWSSVAAQTQYDQDRITIRNAYQQAQGDMNRLQAMLRYYERSALPHAVILLQQGLKTYSAGEMDYTTYLQSLETAVGIRTDYLQVLYQYNQAVLNTAYWSGIIYIPGNN